LRASVGSTEAAKDVVARVGLIEEASNGEEVLNRPDLENPGKAPAESNPQPRIHNVAARCRKAGKIQQVCQYPDVAILARSGLFTQERTMAMRRSYILESTDTFSHDSMHANDLRANHLCQSQAVCGPVRPAPLDASPVWQTCHGLVRDHATPEVRAIRTCSMTRGIHETSRLALPVS
jgi:hypothetical protein